MAVDFREATFLRFSSREISSRGEISWRRWLAWTSADTAGHIAV